MITQKQIKTIHPKTLFVDNLLNVHIRSYILLGSSDFFMFSISLPVSIVCGKFLCKYDGIWMMCSPNIYIYMPNNINQQHFYSYRRTQPKYDQFFFLENLYVAALHVLFFYRRFGISSGGSSGKYICIWYIHNKNDF